MDAEALKLTEEEIDGQMTPAGGWTRATLAGWGVPWPPPRGWRQALLKGEPIPRAQRLRVTALLRDGRSIELPESKVPEAVWKIGASLAAHKADNWTGLKIEAVDFVEAA